MKSLNSNTIIWTPELAYVIGLITTDGNLSKDGRHLAFISKDLELINTFKRCLKLNNKISIKKSGYSNTSIVYWIQFGNINFYKFLVNLGLTPNKSKTMSELKIPTRYFFDFLRGHFDGDGSFYSYWDKRWISSFMFYLIFISSSLEHLTWLRNTLTSLLGVRGHINMTKKNRAYQLKYAKIESIKIIAKMYQNSQYLRLERKFKKVYTALVVNDNHK